MTPQRHALLARQLIEACGGPHAAAEATRLEKSRLSDFQNPNLPQAVMPADVIYDLERMCGQPLYSRALYDASRYGGLPDDAVTEACEASETASQLQRLVRGLARTGRPPSEADRRELARVLSTLLADVQGVAEAIDAPSLRVVGGSEP